MMTSTARSASLVAVKFSMAFAVTFAAMGAVGCLRKSGPPQTDKEAAKATETLDAMPPAPATALDSGEMKLAAGAPVDVIAPSSEASTVPVSPSAIGARLGCDGSYRTAFEEAFRAQGNALAGDLFKSRFKGAAGRELWRHVRLAALRSVGASAGSLASELPESTSGGNDASARSSLLGSSNGSAEGSLEAWSDDAVRCKNLGALFAALGQAATLAKTEGDALCNVVAPVRVGALAAQVACRVETRGGRASDVARAATEMFEGRAGSLSPRCGDGFARACEEIVRTHLAGSGRGECEALGKDTVQLGAIQAWACGDSQAR